MFRKIFGSFWVSWFVITAVMLLLIDYAHADVVGASAGPVSDVLNELIKVVAMALGLLLTGLVGVVIAKVKAKWNIDISNSLGAMMQDWAWKAVHYVEEQSHKLADNETLNGNEKLNMAVKFIMDFVDHAKVKEFGEEKLRKLVESVLNQARIHMTDTTATATVKLDNKENQS